MQSDLAHPETVGGIKRKPSVGGRRHSNLSFTSVSVANFLMRIGGVLHDLQK